MAITEIDDSFPVPSGRPILLDMDHEPKKHEPKNLVTTNQDMIVTLVTSDQTLEKRFSSAFNKINKIDFRVIRGTLRETENQICNGAIPALMIVDLDTKNTTEIEVLERLKLTRLSDTQVVAVSDHLDEDLVRRFLKMRLADWLPKKGTDDDLAMSCHEVIEVQKTALRAQNEAFCCSFFPAAGGVGNSTLAVQTAFLIARKKEQYESTCIVDLNFQTGAVADYLNLRPALQIDEILADPERLDEQLMEVMLSRHETDIAVLAAPKSAAHHQEISEDFVTHILGLASQIFDNVIIDLPPIWFPWSDNVLLGSNKFFVVTEFTVPALRHARVLLDAIRMKSPDSIESSVIVNKFKRKIMGSGLIKKDAQELLGNGLAGFVSDHQELVLESINRGEPVFQIRSASGLEKEITDIVMHDW